MNEFLDRPRTMNEICKHLGGVSKRTAYRHIAALRKEGFDVVRIAPGSGKRSSRYVIYPG